MNQSPTELVAQLCQGNRRALARTITLIETGGAAAHELLTRLYPFTGQATVIGVTGSPGTGKSTLVNAVAKVYRQQGKTVGIVAVDPTSPFTGGALLGDRVRMRDLSGDPGIFIRSMATRGSLGGLARATADVILALDAAGFERVLVETVGVGQAEVEIASTAHTTIVVEAPGMGDEVQAIKAGVLEIADVFAVNKADREGSDRTVMALRMMLGIAPEEVRGISHHGQLLTIETPSRQRAVAWEPPIIKTVALQDQGILELVAAVEQHRAFLIQSDLWGARERVRAASELESIVRRRLLQKLAQLIPQGSLQELVDQIARRVLDPYTAAEQLLAALA
ncbi:MAG: methylmalonyl Co-A mutase-associated GTPase MeaB [Anaerolineae bacterium]|jgi:LAO/AO transport system kinase|uniref:methylmalonyl Co-A mutase-associated GTPase MeaB n=1 Tax=Candidatus Amarolinea dominans TaxID=3140696 RepID=UPI001E0747DE|nr:methylmalonyl Co-A mutase-associated GTPase MeaB [Anaerolineae bacterium]MBK7199377.1 methylmalonyl Co-A mutase-associated GTPase MeaB [Anaerolineae bacterium]MBK9093111.1 methylmalonyl Co-A mutase-associated GTPase MeaB [Anaerolineae bacterium]MBK9230158.1 methylmalonyl Co-A mutase-associated GTPase MeaB [Anaerolineae bacterium]